MIALFNMAAKIGCSAIEQIIDNLVVLWAKPIGVLVIDNMVA
jgi:hypothetical protein